MDPYIQFAQLIDDTFHTGIAPQNENRPFVKIFRRLLAPEEVSLALCLTDSYASCAEAAERSGFSPERTASMLHDMAKRGVIFEFYVSGVPYYKLMNYTPGIFEAITSDDLDKEMASYIMEFIQEIEDYGKRSTKKIIHAGLSIRTETYRSSSEEIRLFLDKTDIYAVADCLCRLVQKHKGHPCGHPIHDMCIQTGAYAEYFINNGHSRRVSRAEVDSILLFAKKAGLYQEIYPVDYDHGCAFICNCCKCGCLVLRASGRLRTIPYVKSSVSIDPALCQSCGACSRECPESAIYMEQNTGKYHIDSDLCFDCGLCLLVCQANAISSST